MPWGRIDDTWYDHPKLDRLQGAGEHPDRLAAAGLESLAWSWCNRFLTDGHIPLTAVIRIGGSRELADLLVSVGRWIEEPGGYEIHDFLRYNDSREQVMARRSAEAKRKADWRAGKGRRGPDDDSPGGTSLVGEPDVPPGVPPGVPAGQGSRDVKLSRVESRQVSRDSTRANPDPTRPVPSRPNESLQRGSRAGTRPDVAALLERGWPRVTKAQRAVLDEVAGRHDTTGHAFAAEAIRLAPDGADPLEAVMAADRMWQESQRRRISTEEAEAAAAKADERAVSPPPWLEDLAGKVGAR